MRKKYLVLLVMIFSIIGFISSTYLAWDHYRVANGFLCDLGESFGCDITKESKYSEIFNIPVGIFGMFWFLVIAGLAMIERKYNITEIMLGWGIIGLIFVGYFVHGEYLLGAICPYCTIAHASIILIFISTFYFYIQKIM